jgi:dCMP deaminase
MAGQTQVSWDDSFMDLVNVISERSKDTHTKVGCLIAGTDHEILSMGYNGLPRGINDDIPERQQTEHKYRYFEHAERNAIYNAARQGIRLLGATLYTQWCPCADCARAIIQAGIKEVVVKDVVFIGRGLDWTKSQKAGVVMLMEADVKLRMCNNPRSLLTTAIALLDKAIGEEEKKARY